MKEAIRNHNDTTYASLAAAIEQRRMVAIDLLYAKLDDRRRTIARFVLSPIGDTAWPCGVVRHWKVD